MSMERNFIKTPYYYNNFAFQAEFEIFDFGKQGYLISGVNLVGVSGRNLIPEGHHCCIASGMSSAASTTV